MSVSFAWEKLEPLLADGLGDLAVQDFREIEDWPDATPLDVDWGEYMKAERCGLYKIVSARRDGHLIGYNSFYLNHHVRHRSGALWAISDVLYLRPTERRGHTGVAFLRATERLLREAGVIRVQYSIKRHVQIGRRGGTVGNLLQHLGYEHTEETYAQLLR